MKWSWKIGEFAGIGVYVHATFVLLLVWIGLSSWLQGESVAGTLAAVGFIMALFACVLLHEFGHALTAKKYGIKTRDITLLPIGGVARLERMPDDPKQELWVALAGPAVNVVIAAVLFVGLQIATGFSSLPRLSLSEGSFAERLLMSNLTLVAFNMLPAFPMDGGRVLRALLATRMDYIRATQIAAGIGQGMALLFGFIGLFSNPFLLFIALFVWIGAAQESAMVQIRTSLGGIPVSRVMQTNFATLSPQDKLSRVVELILAGSQHDFPVVEDGHVVGILDRDTFIKALAEKGQSASVTEGMRRDLPEVDTHEMVEIGRAHV